MVPTVNFRGDFTINDHHTYNSHEEFLSISRFDILKVAVYNEVSDVIKRCG